MFGQATLDIPRSGTIGPSHTDGLSDKQAMIMGCCAAWTLSEQDGDVTVSLECGKIIVIGYDTLRGRLTIGHLTKG
jgi:hypothetical protein